MASQTKSDLYVTGADGCRGGWVTFTVNLGTGATEVEVSDVVSLLRNRPKGLSVLAIDIPIGLPNGPRLCDGAARGLLRSPRCSSVFSAPCRAALAQPNHACASRTNRSVMGKGLSIQAWGIAPKIKEVDEVIKKEHQAWVYEVHPEVSFWCLNSRIPMPQSKSCAVGRSDRLSLLRQQFPGIERHLADKPAGVKDDDLLDAAVAAWTGLRISRGVGESVCTSQEDSKGLSAQIYY